MRYKLRRGCSRSLFVALHMAAAHAYPFMCFCFGFDGSYCRCQALQAGQSHCSSRVWKVFSCSLQVFYCTRTHQGCGLLITGVVLACTLSPAVDSPTMTGCRFLTLVRALQALSVVSGANAEMICSLDRHFRDSRGLPSRGTRLQLSERRAGGGADAPRWGKRVAAKLPCAIR